MTARPLLRGCRITVTCWRERSKISCRATRRCAAVMWSAASAGIVTACRSKRWRRRRWGSAARMKSASSAWPRSTNSAARWCSPMSTNGAKPSRAWAAGWISTTTTRPWTPRSWRVSGGSSSNCGSRAASISPTASCRTVGSSAPRSAISRQAATTRMCRIPRSRSAPRC